MKNRNVYTIHITSQGKPSAEGTPFVGQFEAAVSLPQEISNPLGDF
jgi:hypothetical protein